MRIVVTGATGNVGTSVVRALGADAQVDEIVSVARRLPTRTAPRTR
jgi:UDP-glucose 4-epimerase